MTLLSGDFPPRAGGTARGDGFDDETGDEREQDQQHDVETVHDPLTSLALPDSLLLDL